jgi:hypothetical protein
MTRRAAYRELLRQSADWEPFLLANSGLPGPRGNLELAQAVADEGNEDQFRHWLALGPDLAPVNSPEEFLAFCGILGTGALLVKTCKASAGRRRSDAERAPDAADSLLTAPAAVASLLLTLAHFAADPRWRAREAVAMALQRWGDEDMASLLRAMVEWSHGSPWEQRAAAAALCEPRLLTNPQHAASTSRILDDITASLQRSQDRKCEAFRVLRQGLGYCWSVAVCACPDVAKPLMEHWFTNPDADIRWIMRENLRKNRLARLDPQWTARWFAELT